MKLYQYRGPFKANDTITIKSRLGYEYVHIGIQIPDKQPIARQKWVRPDGISEDTSHKEAMEQNPLNEIEDFKAEGWESFQSASQTDIEINGTKYRLSASDILEFDDISVSSWDITMLRDLPWGTIIDIIYEESTT